MDSATWWRTPAAASAARRLRPEVSKNSSTALSSNEGELARSITAGAPATASLSPSPVMVLTPLLGEAARTSWPPWRRMATVFEPIRPVPPMTTIFMVYPPLSATCSSNPGAKSPMYRSRHKHACGGLGSNEFCTARVFALLRPESVDGGSAARRRDGTQHRVRQKRGVEDRTDKQSSGRLYRASRAAA